MDAGHAHGKLILGRSSPGEPSPKARPSANLATVAGPTGAATEVRQQSDFIRITSLENLYQCWLYARRGKASHPRIQRFDDDALRYLVSIQQRLRERRYTFGPYKTFTVQEKKFRHVVDAPMKDRIVHWMLYRYMLPIWQPRFIHDNYGNIPGRGTHAAVHRLAQFARREHAQYALQLDISKYFYSVQHEQLLPRALRYIGDHDIRQLLSSLIRSFETDGLFDELFAPDSPYRLTQAKGMPIGGLLSQWFANIYLNDTDHWVKQDLRARCYIRYVDDMVFLAKSRDELLEAKEKIIERLSAEGLVVHPKKIRLAPANAGIPFLGYVVWPTHISAGRYLRSRYLHRLRQHETQGIDRSESLASYEAALKHTGPSCWAATSKTHRR
ncbi:reverse transcriptase domain-containing protein [Paracandidimonas soli]|uniref:reverse transcriptase domain-containing protein n=1 Tax=Paracandidimonas soli TaxID=1917182 RepID=UPI00360FED71